MAPTSGVIVHGDRHGLDVGQPGNERRQLRQPHGRSCSPCAKPRGLVQTERVFDTLGHGKAAQIVGRDERDRPAGRLADHDLGPAFSVRRLAAAIRPQPGNVDALDVPRENCAFARIPLERLAERRQHRRRVVAARRQEAQRTRSYCDAAVAHVRFGDGAADRLRVLPQPPGLCPLFQGVRLALPVGLGFEPCSLYGITWSLPSTVACPSRLAAAGARKGGEADGRAPDAQHLAVLAGGRRAGRAAQGARHVGG